MTATKMENSEDCYLLNDDGEMLLDLENIEGVIDYDIAFRFNGDVEKQLEIPCDLLPPEEKVVERTAVFKLNWGLRLLLMLFPAGYFLRSCGLSEIRPKTRQRQGFWKPWMMYLSIAIIISGLSFGLCLIVNSYWALQYDHQSTEPVKWDEMIPFEDSDFLNMDHDQEKWIIGHRSHFHVLTYDPLNTNTSQVY